MIKGCHGVFLWAYLLGLQRGALSAVGDVALACHCKCTCDVDVVRKSSCWRCALKYQGKGIISSLLPQVGLFFEGYLATPTQFRSVEV